MADGRPVGLEETEGGAGADPVAEGRPVGLPVGTLLKSELLL